MRLDPGQACAFVHGGQVEIGGEAGADPTAVLGPGGALLGLARRRADGLKSLCVVGEAGDA